MSLFRNPPEILPNHLKTNMNYDKKPARKGNTLPLKLLDLVETA